MDVRGHLDLLLLSVLADAGPVHGYAVITALRDRSAGVFDLPEGTVYPALQRLERAGLVTSDWDDSTARRRRVYRLTDDGHRARAEKKREWRGFVSGIQAVIGPLAAENRSGPGFPAPANHLAAENRGRPGLAGGARAIAGRFAVGRTA